MPYPNKDVKLINHQFTNNIFHSVDSFAINLKKKNIRC